MFRYFAVHVELFSTSAVKENTGSWISVKVDTPPRILMRYACGIATTFKGSFKRRLCTSWFYEPASKTFVQTHSFKLYTKGAQTDFFTGYTVYKVCTLALQQHVVGIGATSVALFAVLSPPCHKCNGETRDHGLKRLQPLPCHSLAQGLV